MSIDRAVILLSSNDEIENRNGCALIINAAATAANIPEIINSSAIPLLMQKSTSTNEDLRMKFCWAINNLCVHDQGRDAVFRQGVVNCFPAILRSQDVETLRKACWALTNIARHPQAQQQIVSSGTFASLVQILSNNNDELRGIVLQPLCNLVLDANTQLAFLNSGGLRPTVASLKSRDDKVKELAVTLVSFVTTHHDSVREGLLDAGVLTPICDIINGDGTPKMQEYAVNALVNLSLADAAESAILKQGAVPPIVGLLTSPVTKLQQQSAMLLSNLLTNAGIREAVRYLSWLDPLLALIRGGDPNTVQQALRCIVNITFDAHCRYMLTRIGSDRDIENARNKLQDPTVSQLADTALKNFSVSVSNDIKQEVDRTLSSGGVKVVNAPTAQRTAATQDAFAGLDDILGGSTPSNRGKPPAPSPSKPKARDPLADLDDLFEDNNRNTFSRPTQHARDPLDDLLDIPAQPQVRQSNTASSRQQQHVRDPIDDLLDTPSQPQVRQSNTSASRQQHHVRDPIDDLLDTPSQPQVRQSNTNVPRQSNTASRGQSNYSQSNQGLADLDDLLGGLSVSPPPKKPANNPVDDLDSILSSFGNTSTPTPSHSNNNQFDAIDSILSGMGGSNTYHQPPPRTSTRQASANSGFDDIDSLLSDIGSTPSRPSTRGASNYRAGGESIDDLLAGLGAPTPSRASHNRNSGFSAIDDLLNDLGS